MNEVSTSWHSYPKVHAIGHAAIDGIFGDDVIVEEKIDGSQFSFGVYGGELRVRSKGVEMDPDHPEGMFAMAIEVAKELSSIILPDTRYVCEYLMKPKHNTLAYDFVPTKNLVLLDVLSNDEVYFCRATKELEAKRIGLQVTPCLYSGKVDSPVKLFELMSVTPLLGGKFGIEGLVVKNYAKFTKAGKAMMGKYVSEKFKETHNKSWKERNPGNSEIITVLSESLRTEARWEKAVQHLREGGSLQNSPKDIGLLIKEVQKDTEEETVQYIKDELYKWAWPKISRGMKKGLPEWYKERLLKSAFED